MNISKDTLEKFEWLIGAAQGVVDAWEKGDLAGAVYGLELSIDEAKDALSGLERRPRLGAPSNSDRAEFAAHGLDEYASRKGGGTDYDDPLSIARDMVSDLMHLIRGHGADPVHEIDMARMHFEEEENEMKIAWKPQFSPWRHGGWYVTNVRYPDGAIGCVSNKYEDKKWRIVCDKRSSDQTYRTRDEAARAEYALVEGLKVQQAKERREVAK